MPPSFSSILDECTDRLMRGAKEKGGKYKYAEGDFNDKSRLQPVKLQPSWEENNLPEDELNFRSLTMDEASLALNQPPDKFKLVYLTFLIHGIGVLMPWNMFITAMDYFIGYKLSEGYIGFTFPYIPNFMQYLTFCSQIPNVAFNWMNIFVQIGGSMTTRVVWSIIAGVVLFIVTVALAMIDTSGFAYGFFWITMITVVLMNMANGIYQNTIYGMAAKLPPQYTGAVVLGNNISGTFAAIVSLVSSMTTDNIRMAAIYYFITALFVLLICFDTYFALPLNRFYRHFELKDKTQQQKASKSGIKEKPPYWEIFKKSFPQLANVFMVFFVTLAVFPAVYADVKPVSKDFPIQKYFASVTCFITFNIMAMLGSLLPSLVIWPAPKWLWIPVVLRFAYIPFFLLCNYQVVGVERVMPVLIKNDWAYWVISSTMGFTSGYWSSLAMMYTPRQVEDRHAPMAGMFAAAALITGIFTGILITFLWPWVIGHVG
ncbi:unnamed protein product [Acanthoscelides obtectus]|uniref:Equilibrative nucleoside transporter 1 n=2 Tax=Acanthoscelides obtectus TaxID=200917 RepID=A0A9P0NV51_ACAOB|nr:unnamed protein product [Acanthoscelides obtectus]CAK1621148.1 Equilibrative nucleoside transporter 1 [Acanthoscelides obtectus]